MSLPVAGGDHHVEIGEIGGVAALDRSAAFEQGQAAAGLALEALRQGLARHPAEGIERRRLPGAVISLPFWPSGSRPWALGPRPQRTRTLARLAFGRQIDAVGARTPAGDSACDIMFAGVSSPPKTRGVFHASPQVDDTTWARGRGRALSAGLIAFPYYRSTDLVLDGIARRVVAKVLADHKASG